MNRYVAKTKDGPSFRIVVRATSATNAAYIARKALKAEKVYVKRQKSKN